jgi:hypothetical protein
MRYWNSSTTLELYTRSIMSQRERRFGDETRVAAAGNRLAQDFF